MPSKASDRPFPERRRSIVPPTRWYSSFRQACLREPALRGNAAYWLQVEGSLTRHLQLRCQHGFHVEVAAEGFAVPASEEAATLDIPERQLAWIREVRLCGDNEPWVLARTIIPLHTLAGRGRRLRHLGRTPLGAWLFSHREWTRGPLQAGLCEPADGRQPWCARRSVFASGPRQLLVGEYFLPALLDQAP
ncbi:chorismate lyase [Marinobacter daqiaonensis]|uniref:Probable chorismate pyruvate-lyase n=1 Tax=Marinobacter daqiaonensis TaxID=650891 RepID=A0A1I6JRI7_9GAMM|nr:chorismate lyase [Marinobacter daqiaonensis]SFR81593.1 chorismate lyase [Marinobacter daqiaonensis]